MKCNMRKYTAAGVNTFDMTSNCTVAEFSADRKIVSFDEEKIVQLLT